MTKMSQLIHLTHSEYILQSSISTSRTYGRRTRTQLQTTTQIDDSFSNSRLEGVQTRCTDCMISSTVLQFQMTFEKVCITETRDRDCQSSFHFFFLSLSLFISSKFSFVHCSRTHNVESKTGERGNEILAICFYLNFRDISVGRQHRDVIFIQ